MYRTNIKDAPFLHDSEIALNLQVDLLIGLLAVMIIAVVQNGLRVLALCAVSAFAAWATETLGLLMVRRLGGTDIRSITMGLIIAMLCPVTVPWWLPAGASVISVLFVRVLLGPHYKTLFMTPVIGWLYMLSVAPEYMTVYPAARSFSAFPILDTVPEFQHTRSIAQLLQSNQTPPYSFMDLMTGNYAGGMGTTCIFVILAVCVYFIFRKSMAWQVSLSMIVTVSAFALVFNRAQGNLLFSVLYELTATSYIFVAVFVAGDIINAPMLTPAKIIFGVLIGVFTMLFRYLGMGEHCVVIALFIANLLSELLDLAALKIQTDRMRKSWRKKAKV